MAAHRSPDAEEKARLWSQEPAVAPWIELSMQLVASRPKDPPAASRAYALVSLAMHDAVVAAWRAKYAYRRTAPEGADAMVPAAPDPCYPSEHAAVAGAASRVLAHAFPEQPAARFERMAAEAAEARVMAGVNYRSDVMAGLALGRSVATAVIARAKGDLGRKWNGKRPQGPRHWDPPPESVARPTQPLAGTWRTWVLRSGRQLRPPPPPRFGSRRFVAEAREVVRIRETLTPEQKRIAKFWEGGEGTPLPPGIWNQVVLAYVRQKGLSTPRAARTFALLNVAMSDAGVAAWDAKYAYWSPRPENAIRDLGLDPRWKPFLATPFFPAYVSGHATYSAAAGEVLAHLFPENAALWRAKAAEAGMSRIYGGIHYRADNEVGARMGRQIGRLVVERAKRDGAET